MTSKFRQGIRRDRGSQSRKINSSAFNALIQNKACAEHPSTEQVPSADQIAAFTPLPGCPSVLDDIRRRRQAAGGES